MLKAPPLLKRLPEAIIILMSFYLVPLFAQANDTHSYIKKENCNPPPIKDFLIAPYLVNRWIDNGCIDPLELEIIVAPMVKSIPASKISDNINGYDLLSRLKPSNKEYIKKLKFYEDRKKYRAQQNKKNRLTKAKAKKEALESFRKQMRDSGYLLEIDNWTWRIEYGYAIASGLVRNISDKKLKNIEAIVMWYTEDGDFITSDTTLIEYTTLMPGQASPFKLAERANPMMKRAQLEFKQSYGNKIPSYNKRR